jgi:hypothetical protein
VLSTGLASASYQLLERPVRQWPGVDRPRWQLPVIAAGVAVSVLVAVVVVPRVEPRARVEAIAAEPGLDAQLRDLLSTLTPVTGLDHVAIFDDVSKPEMDCTGTGARGCVVVEGTGPTLLLMGDSTAHMLLPGFVTIAEEHGLTLVDATRPGCAWQADHYRPTYRAEPTAACRRIRPDTYDRVIPELDPDIIVLMNSTAFRGPFEPGSAPQVEERAATLRSLDRLARAGRQLVVLEPVPRGTDLRFDAARCLQRATFAEQCRFTVDPSATWGEELVRDAAAERADVVTVDLDRIACPMLPVCDPIVDGTAVWRIEGHLTGTYVDKVTPQLTGALAAAGVRLG